MGEFEKRGVQVLGCSVDSHFSHLKWKEMDVNNGGIGNVQYPLIADLDKSIARSYDVLLGTKDVTVFDDDDEVQTSVGGKVALRASFLIDEEGVVRHSVINDLPLGRNIDEMLRTVDALAFHTANGEVCPAGWKEGDDGMTPSDEGMKSYVAANAEKL
jgi:peroxiredoxin (alkyl hydroperoxide reductase subunit C)|tara:strand:- start:114 stop:587 length:474 start_codon:yes stop_codon:yes gene_type:complete